MKLNITKQLEGNWQVTFKAEDSEILEIQDIVMDNEEPPYDTTEKSSDFLLMYDMDSPVDLNLITSI